MTATMENAIKGHVTMELPRVLAQSYASEQLEQPPGVAYLHAGDVH